MQVSQKIYQRLTETFSPSFLEVHDESHQHIGHAGAKEGGHYAIEISAEIFQDKSLIESHRLIYQALEVLMQANGGIHALRIKVIK
jgi:BolA protein